MVDLHKLTPLAVSVAIDGLFIPFSDEIKLMQFTGLKDKNNVEIFDGDVLSFTVFDHNDADTQYKGCVVWADCGWRIWKKPVDEYYGADGGFDLGWVHAQDDEIEIIGNIYEHPELLEATDDQ